MKTIIIILASLTITLQTQASTFSASFIAPGTFRADHFNDPCIPECANQKNNGRGVLFAVDYDEKLHIGFFYLNFRNSYGDPGRAEAIIPALKSVSIGPVKIETSVLLMKIYGYKNTDGSLKKPKLLPWPMFTVGINPFYNFTNRIYVNYNMLYLPTIKIDWITFEIRF